MNKINFKIHESEFDVARKVQDLTILSCDDIINHMNKGEITIANGETTFVGEVKLIEFLGCLMGVAKEGERKNNDGQFQGLPGLGSLVWKSFIDPSKLNNAVEGFELTIEYESDIIRFINSDGKEVVFFFDELISEIESLMVKLFSELETICPEYLLNNNYLKVKSER